MPHYTQEEKQEWIEEGLKKGADYVFVVCDTFSYEDYPVYVMPGELAEADKKYSENMQRIHERVGLAQYRGPFDPQTGQLIQQGGKDEKS
jgi:hypothetical protein